MNPTAEESLFFTREVLKGLVGVKVVVEEFPRKAEEAGFALQTFQTDVELKLRLAGIRVLTDDSDEAWPSVLYLNVNPLHTKTGKMAVYGIQLALIQAAIPRYLLDGELGKVAAGELTHLVRAASMWSRTAAGYGTLASVRSLVKDVVDLFVNDWLAVNR